MEIKIPAMLLLVITTLFVPSMSSAQGILEYPFCKKVISEYLKNPNIKFIGMDEMCVKAYQNMHPQPATSGSSVFPSGPPNYYEVWKLIRPSDIHDGIVNGDNLPPLIPYLESQGVTDPEIKKWTPFILQNYCTTSTPQEPSCFKYYTDNNNEPDDTVEMQEGNVPGLIQWIRGDIPLQTAVQYSREISSDYESSKAVYTHVTTQCPHHTYSDDKIAKINPYQAVGQCLIISGKVLQIISPHVSLVDTTPDTMQMNGVVLNYENGHSPNKGGQVSSLADCYKVKKWLAVGGEETAPECKVIIDFTKP